MTVYDAFAAEMEKFGDRMIDYRCELTPGIPRHVLSGVFQAVCEALYAAWRLDK
jgi:hypothetical protein